MPLPSFTISQTPKLTEIIGDVVGAELVARRMMDTEVLFTSNVDPDDLVLYEGDLHRVRPVRARINTAGAVERDYKPVQLLANDAGLNVTGIQWTVQVFIDKRLVKQWTFDAPAAGSVLDLASVAPVPATGPNGVTRGPMGWRTRAVPVVGDPTMAQWVDENGLEIGDPVPWSQVVSEAIASAAAEAAVTADIAGRDMLEGTDPRVPKLGDLDAFRVLDNQNRAALEVTPTGTTKIGSTEIEHRDYEGLRVYDTEERIAFDVRPDGTTFIGQLSSDSSSAGVNTVHVLIGMGQSNMSGRGLPISSEMDPTDPRIFQYGANASEVTTATVPLDMVDTPYGVSPLTLIAREYLQRLPNGDVILLIPAARGGSALGHATTESSSGVWNVAYAGASVDLYSLAKTQIDAALTAVEGRWPGATTRIVGMFWHQGEANEGTSTADYSDRFDAIVADLRTHLSDPDMPVVLGGMVPEWVSTHAGLEDIVDAHVDTPNRVVRTGYAIPPANGGGTFGLDPSNIVHFHREGVEELSARMLRAWDRALRNTTSSVPNPPAVVSATVNGTTLAVEWSQPMCRYTAFTVEYSENGGSWTAITHSTVDTTATATITGTLPVRVRVATTNEIGTSATSTPVYATVIKEP